MCLHAEVRFTLADRKDGQPSAHGFDLIHLSSWGLSKIDLMERVREIAEKINTSILRSFTEARKQDGGSLYQPFYNRRGYGRELTLIRGRLAVPAVGENFKAVKMLYTGAKSAY